jgi:indole-3-glycerol phosphate synthase
VIGINNRNLHTFNVDLNTTKRLIEGSAGSSESREDILFVALSGISTRQDVEQFETINVRAVLVGKSSISFHPP